MTKVKILEKTNKIRELELELEISKNEIKSNFIIGVSFGVCIFLIGITVIISFLIYNIWSCR